MNLLRTSTFCMAIVGSIVLASCDNRANGTNTKSADTASADAPACPGTGIFSQQAIIFDAVTICATPEVPVDKLSYAANVAAEWIDNDGDGKADEPRVVEQIRNNNAILVMTKSGPTDQIFEALIPVWETGVFQDLAAEETNPGFGRRDASQEEIHHLIMTSGWSRFRPEIFGEAKGSALYSEWELAEKQGHYYYDDQTCDPSCKVIEFFYLATAAYLGSDADLAPDEMRLKNREELTKALPATVEIIESADYAYPHDHWPTGKYTHQGNIITGF